MAKSGTGHTREKSDSKKVAQKLQELTKKLSDKSIYAVKKHYDVYAVAEIKTNASVVKDLPTYEIADRFTTRLNRGHAKVEHINRRLPELLTEYQQKQFDWYKPYKYHNLFVQKYICKPYLNHHPL